VAPSRFPLVIATWNASAPTIHSAKWILAS
jgi:hypothetical protein